MRPAHELCVIDWLEGPSSCSYILHASDRWYDGFWKLAGCGLKLSILECWHKVTDIKLAQYPQSSGHGHMYSAQIKLRPIICPGFLFTWLFFSMSQLETSTPSKFSSRLHMNYGVTIGSKVVWLPGVVEYCLSQCSIAGKRHSDHSNSYIGRHLTGGWHGFKG